MKRELKLNIIKLGTIICGILLAINVLVPVALRKYVEYKFIGTHRASSIGIIGGADGPTSIFIASKNFATGIGATVFLSILTIVGCIILWRSKKREK